ncbi:retrovirus-related pol polyprotein from transposon TNT 1-94 [Tanacetum coccineum]
MPISTRKPKRTVNQSVATPHRKNVASDSTIQKPRSTFRKLYKHVRNTCSWWYTKLTPPGYKWEPKSKTWNVKPNVSVPLGTESRTTSIWNPRLSGDPLCPTLYCLLILLQLVEIILFIVDSGCSKHITGNLKLLVNFMEKYLGTVRFGNDQVAPILGYGDLNDIVTGLPKLEFAKDHLCSSYELKKAKRKSFKTKMTPSSKGQLQLLRMDLCGPMRIHLNSLLEIQRRNIRSSHRFPHIDSKRTSCSKGIEHQTSIARTPEQKGVVEKRYHTLVEAARTMLSAVKIPLFFLAEAIATACFTQNCSLVIRRHEKNHTTYQWKEKPSVKNLSLFLAPNAYIFRDDENHDRMKEKDHDTSGLAPQCQTMTLEHNSLSPDPQMFDEYFNGATPVVSKSSTVTTDDASDKRQCVDENILILNKERLVSKGYRHEEGIDFEESFAPVA